MLYDKRSKASIFDISFFVNIISWLAVFSLNGNGLLSVDFLDIGQGDSIFITTPQNHTILIDGGPGSKVLDKLAQRMPFGDRSIDLIVLTHTDRDHLEGILSVLKTYKVENVLWNGATSDTLLYKEWIRLLGEEKANVVFAKAGQRINFISNGNFPLYMDVIYPIESVFGENKSASTNDYSVVNRLVFGENSFLFTGDISFTQEREMIDAKPMLGSDVLKVAHHGSKFSTGEDFLAVVSPQFAVIQVGKNSYGHPASEVLEKLEKFGISIFRNDLHGDVSVFSNGKQLNLKTNN